MTSFKEEELTALPLRCCCSVITLCSTNFPEHHIKVIWGERYWDEIRSGEFFGLFHELKLGCFTSREKDADDLTTVNDIVK